MRGIGNRQKKNVTPKRDYRRAKSELDRKLQKQRESLIGGRKDEKRARRKDEGGADASSSD